jgi:hypothetical membrane protein
MEARHVEEGDAKIPEQRQVVPVLAAAGIVGPIVFTAVIVVQGLLHPDYSHVALPISALAARPGGWIQNVNFFLFGALFTAYAIGLHRGVRPSQGGALGPAFLVLSGVGSVVLGAFPWRDVGGSFIEPTGHVVGVFMCLLGAAIGFIVISRRLARDPHWQTIARYTLATGIAVVALFFAFGALAEAPDAPLHPWAGAVQRVMIALLFACTVSLGLRLLHVGRRAETPP